MTRKDTILIAVVINAGLLAILFTTAVIYDTDKVLEQTEFVASAPNSRPIAPDSTSSLIADASTGDEVDNVLKYYPRPSSQMIVVENPVAEVYVPDPMDLQPDAPMEEERHQERTLKGQDQFVEIRVKKGDVLEKIARTHGTSVSAIKKMNHLPDERLSIGQVLKIPVKQESSTLAQTSLPKRSDSKLEGTKTGLVKDSASSEAVYYIIKSGDNPWKIAKQFNVKYEEILRLNHLDEDKARSLKIGDRIRVK